MLLVADELFWIAPLALREIHFSDFFRLLPNRC
jgi:hypothetical protein